MGVIAQAWPWSGSGLRLPPRTVWPLTQLLDAAATTTAKRRKQHARKLPERTRGVNPVDFNDGVDPWQISSLVVDLKHGRKPSQSEALRLDALDGG